MAMPSIDELGSRLLHTMAANGWRVEKRTTSAQLLPEDTARRYVTLPYPIVAFLSGIKSCVNPSETAWLLTAEDYHLTGTKAFRWNEFEQMSRDAAAGNDDWSKQIEVFWSTHFPFLLAVHSNYDYLAVSLAQDNFGSVVAGSGPEFEDTIMVAASFDQYLSRHEDALREKDRSTALHPFI
jgi:hypothetical protein